MSGMTDERPNVVQAVRSRLLFAMHPNGRKPQVVGATSGAYRRLPC